MSGLGSPEKRDSRGVQHHPLGPYGINGMPESNEQTFEVVLTGHLDFASFYVHMIDAHFILSCELNKIETDGSKIFRQFILGLFKGHKNSGGETDPEIKIQKAMSLFDELGIKNTTESLAREYISKAFVLFQKVSVDEKRKNEMTNLANSLIGREY